MDGRRPSLRLIDECMRHDYCELKVVEVLNLRLEGVQLLILIEVFADHVEVCVLWVLGKLLKDRVTL